MSVDARRGRYAQNIRALLSELLRREIRDSSFDSGLLSIQQIELNKDKSVARVYVVLLGADDATQERALSILQSQAGRLRGPLGRAMKTKRVPELRFVLDERPKMDAIIDNALVSPPREEGDD